MTLPAPENLRVDLVLDRTGRRFAWDDVEGAVDSFGVEIDAVIVAAAQHSTEYVKFGLSDGDHSIRVRTRDAADNTNGPWSDPLTFTIEPA